jgi:hypothetical protein
MAKVGLGNFFMDAHMTEKCWETVLHFAVCIAGGVCQRTYKEDVSLCRAVTFCRRQKRIDGNVTQKKTTKRSDEND